jgi:xanthine dehydrogenase accessory factor
MGIIYKQLYSALLAGQQATLVTTLGERSTKKSLYLDSVAQEFTQTSKFMPNSLRLDQGLTSQIMEIFTPKPRLIVFGGGHIASALAPLATALDFDLVIYDDRPTYSSPARFPMARQTICQSFLEVDKYLTIRSSDYVVIATRGHRHDEDCLRFVLTGVEPFYQGMIGSKRRVAIVRKEMLNENFLASRLEKLHSPIGLPIGAVTPAEIAISILAEIVQQRCATEREKGRGSLEAFPDMNLLHYLASERPESAALLTVIATQGSTPRKAGAQMASFFDNRTIGSIGGGCAEAGLMGQARSIIGSGSYVIERIDLTDSAEEDGMVCGGWMEVLIDDLPPNV